MSIFKEAMSKINPDDIVASDNNLLPAGDYNLQCDNIEVRTNDYSGKQSISMTFKVLGPKHSGRILYNNIYPFTDNSKYNSQVLQKLGTFALRAGIAKDEINKMDLKDFVGLKAAAKVKIEKSEEYGDKNRISHYKKLIEDIKVDDTDDVPF